ncbi:FAD-dependent monooxygenase [uncultured Friedmanniella sp.]|uniref:FAD-dependent monooxygenase n=1 Tax=uncultured Friedmanniella sp. TaxID=335381 RepID=UPI0035CA63CE
MTSRTVLISGASIAGPALAHWLNVYGFTTTVVERADGIRPGGQTVDLRGAGREVARRMGIEDAVRAATTGEQGVRFVDATGATRAEFGADAYDGEGFVAELEILRGELATLLHEHTRDHTEYLFGDRISGLDDQPGRVRVTFDSGLERDFDLVVAADGIGSRTRRLVFGDEPQFRSLGMYTAYLTMPRAESDGTWARWYNATGGRVITLRPDNLGTTRALLTLPARGEGYERQPVDEQRALLKRTFVDAGWEAPRVVAALDGADDLYFELTGQVRTPHWSRGRVALVGDAGYCASPISGMGTSLALVGAYVLAGELAASEDHRQAFAAYERLLRPYVDKAQQLPPFTPRIAQPRTRAGIQVLNSALWLGSRPWVSRLGRSKRLSPPADAFELPDYLPVPV